LTTGLPLDPGEIGAVICISLILEVSPRIADIIPSDVVPCNPSGDPTTTIFSPSEILEE
jgi:hypothetical protein